MYIYIVMGRDTAGAWPVEAYDMPILARVKCEQLKASNVGVAYWVAEVRCIRE